MEAANAYLSEFMADFNRLFATAPREAEDALRPRPFVLTSVGFSPFAHAHIAWDSSAG